MGVRMPPTWEPIKKLRMCIVGVAALGLADATGGVLEQPNMGNFLVHVMEPITDKKILPEDWPIPGTKTETITVSAAQGEFGSATFVVRPFKQDYINVALRQGPLLNAVGFPFRGSVDLRVVKVWFQNGSGWVSTRVDSKAVLVPELLLHDETLVKIDEEVGQNYLKCQTAKGTHLLLISDPTPKTGRAVSPGSECTIIDAAVLNPIQFRKNQNKQIWITAQVPENHEPGRFEGTLSLVQGSNVLGELRLVIDVLPFRLDEPHLTYSLYYRGVLDSRTGISSDNKDEAQMRAELINMKLHGVNNPTIYQPIEDRNNVARVLRIREDVGMSNQALYFIGLRTEDTRGKATKKYVEEFKALRMLAGGKFTDIYIYGIDEAEPDSLAKQRPIWQELRKNGARIFTAGWKPGYFDQVGDILDLFVDGRPYNVETPDRFHSMGHLVFKYNTPQSGIENPALYRLNYGVKLWQYGYDGAMLYAYQDGFGSVWNDFDSPRFRDHNFTYPTTNSVIDTIAWEGLREGINDVRYLATLENLIDKNSGSQEQKTRNAVGMAKKYLATLKKRNIKEPSVERRQIVQHILNVINPSRRLVTS